MNQIKCIIIDKQANNRDRIASHIREFTPIIHLSGEAQNMESGLGLIRANKPQLVFANLNEADSKGLDWVQKFFTNNVSMILLNTCDQYVLQQLDYLALGYHLLMHGQKSSNQELEAIQKLNSGITKDKQESLIPERKSRFKKIALPVGNSYEFIEVRQILRCEATGSYTTLFTAGGQSFLVSKSLASFEKLLPKDLFFRAHKSHLINLNHVSRYIKGKGGYVLMSDGTHVDLSYRRKDEFLVKLKIQFGFL